MKELTLEEHKSLALDILVNVADFCDKNDIRYFLAFGTLIGAIRHKGFIPWDDDVDIVMPRPDYERFIKSYSDDRYKIDSPYGKNAKRAYSKVVDSKTLKVEGGVIYSDEHDVSGVDIDIFPIDGLPADEKDFRKYLRRKKYLICELYAKVNKVFYGSLKRRLGMLAFSFAKFKNKAKIIAKIDELNNSYPYDESEYVGITGGMDDVVPKNRCKKAWFDETVEADFEDYKFKAPRGYDEILRMLYGDYTQLPPESERITHHSNKIYLK